MIGTGDANVSHPAIPEIINQSQNHRWNFDDERAFVGIEPDETVNGIVVRRQLHSLGIHQVLPNHIRLVIRAKLALGGAHASLVNNWDGQQISLQCA